MILVLNIGKRFSRAGRKIQCHTQWVCMSITEIYSIWFCKLQINNLCIIRKIRSFGQEYVCQTIRLHSTRGGLKVSWADYDAMVQFKHMWFILQHSFPSGPYTPPLSVLQPLDSRGIYIEALILILEKVIWPHHRSDNASQPSVFLMLENRK